MNKRQRKKQNKPKYSAFKTQLELERVNCRIRFNELIQYVDTKKLEGCISPVILDTEMSEQELDILLIAVAHFISSKFEHEINDDITMTLLVESVQEFLESMLHSAAKIDYPKVWSAELKQAVFYCKKRTYTIVVDVSVGIHGQFWVTGRIDPY